MYTTAVVFTSLTELSVLTEGLIGTLCVTCYYYYYN